MRKNLEYYLSLIYPVELIRIPEDEGGGFSACIPQLGRNAFIADGDSVEEVLSNLQSLKEESFSRMLENGIPIPEPIQEEDEEFSGKFLVRVPKELHRNIAQRAKQNNISLNQFVQYIITVGLATSSFNEVVESYCGKFENVLSSMKEVEFNFEKKISYKDYGDHHLHLILGEKNKELKEYSLAG